MADSSEYQRIAGALGSRPAHWLRERSVLPDFFHLVEAGCDPEKLWDGLAAVKLGWDDANTATFESEIGFDPSELETVIRRMRQCADDLERLNIQCVSRTLSEKFHFAPREPGWFPPSEGRPTLGDVLSELFRTPSPHAPPDPQGEKEPQPQRPSAHLIALQQSILWPLRVLALSAEEAAKHVYLRNKPLYDGALRWLVGYVQRQTGTFHDAEVSALVSVVRGDVYDAAAHRRWRERHSPPTS
jgi:hypothetical protein